MPIQRLDASQPGFQLALQQLLDWESTSDEALVSTVMQILAEVKTKGDAALLQYTRQFDHIEAHQMGALELQLDRLRQRR